jgi:predicted metal-dependent HD superfamily phosphohydrolase
MLRLLEQFEGRAAEYAAVSFAAWFHNAVYDTRSRMNEEESAGPTEHFEARAGSSYVSRGESAVLLRWPGNFGPEDTRP